MTAGFQYATEEISLLSQKLDPAVYAGSALLNAVKDFLKRQDTKLRILVESDIPDGHPLLEACSGNPLAEVRKVPVETVALYDCNFMTVDNFGYRYEANRDQYFASVSFYEDGNNISIDHLKQLFGLLFERAAVEN